MLTTIMSYYIAQMAGVLKYETKMPDWGEIDTVSAADDDDDVHEVKLSLLVTRFGSQIETIRAMGMIVYYC